MLKKTITYTDFNGDEVSEEFYFNLNKAEIAEMELGVEGGLSEYLQKIVKTKDGGEIIRAFKDIIRASVGRRSEDGKRFIKNQEITDEFFQTEAYSTLFMELVTNTTSALEFVRGIVPQDMSGDIPTDPEALTAVEEPKDDRPAYIREDRDPTKKELQEMSKEELMEAMQWRNSRS